MKANGEEESDEWKVVIESKEFSIYVINNISIKWVWDTITITYNANWWEFEDWKEIKDIVYNYSGPTEWRKYSHTSNINDRGQKLTDYGTVVK